MVNEERTKEQLINELKAMRQRVAELEASEAKLKNSLKELNKVKENYQMLVDSQITLIVKFDFNGKILFVNKTYCQTFGKEESELLGASFVPLVHVDDREATLKAMENLYRPPYCSYVEQRAMTKDGWRWIGWTGKAISDEHNQITAIVAVGKDITERKCAEKALEEANQQLMDIIEFLPDATFVVDRDKKVIAWNRAIEEMTGVHKKDIIGKGNCAYSIPFYGKPRPTLVDLIEQDETQIQMYYKSVQRNNKTLYTEVYIPPPFNGSGATLWVKTSPLYDTAGNICGAIESIRDITDRNKMAEELNKYRKHLETMVNKRTAMLQNAMVQLQQEVAERELAEEALRQSELQLRRITDNMLDVIGMVNTQGIIHYQSPSCKDVLGYEPEQMVGKSKMDFVHPDDLKQVHTAWKQCINTLSSNKIEFRHRQANGQYIWVETSCKPISNENGLVAEAVLCSRDITERKNAEHMLRLSEERFAKSFNASPNIMSIRTLADGRYIFVNDSFVKQTGYQHEEIIGRTTEELNIYVDSKEYARMMESFTKQGFVHNYKQKFHKKSGDIRLGLISIELMELNGEKCILSNVTDITEFDRLDRQMARLDRLNLIGEMAAGIGHEIRNPMTGVRGLLQILNSKDDFNGYRDYFNVMIEELDRANSIITYFLSLAKNKPVDKVSQSLNNIIETISPLIQAGANEANKYINIELRDIPNLLLDEKEMRQLIINLVHNGLEAMALGGILTVKTYTDRRDVVLAVQDQGQGIKSDVLEKLGTPFITTKDNGTGLGLAVCYSIAERHQAKIEVDTGPYGSTFFVRFKQ